MKPFFSLLLFFTLAVSCYPQGEENKAAITVYNDLINILETKGQNQLIEEYEEKIILLEKGEFNDKLFLDNAGSEILKLYYKYGDFENALKLLIKTINLCYEMKVNSPGQLAHIYNKIAILYVEKRESQKAFEYLEKAKGLLEKNSMQIPSFIYSNYGNAYNVSGITDKALEFYKKASRIIKETRGENSLPSIIVDYNIAIAYQEQGGFDEALEYLDKIILIGEKLMGKDHYELARAFELKGTIYTKQKKYSEAQRILNKTLDIYLNALGDNHFRVGNLYTIFGKLFSEQGNFEVANKYFQKSLAISKKAFGRSNGPVSAVNYEIAKNFMNQENHDMAIDYLEKSMASNMIEGTNVNIGKLGLTQNEFHNLSLFLDSSTDLALSYYENFKKSSNQDYLEKAQEQFKKTDSIIDFFRLDISNIKDKRTVSKNLHHVYFIGMESFLTSYFQKKDLTSLENGYGLLEKSKANILKEEVNRFKVHNFLNIPKEVSILENSLRLDKAFYQSKVKDEQSKKEVDSIKLSLYKNQIFTITRKQDSLQKVLERTYPNYYQLKYQNNVSSLSEIQDYLDEDTSLLAYFNKDSTTYAFTITKNGTSVKRLTTPDLEKNIMAYRKSIVNKQTTSYKPLANALYLQLVAPIEEELMGEKLIIVPDGPLWHVDFDLLLTKNDNSNNPRELSYLLRDYAISYANSATVLLNANNAKKSAINKGECLAFSFSDGNMENVEKNTLDFATLRDAGDDLPGTRAEIRAIEDIIDGQYFFGSAANEENFKKNASNYNILHLALHGEVDNEQPENSKLFFTNNADSQEDGFLYDHEIYALNLPAELAVLSACNTGTGKISKGEGIMSLGNAFQYAGTKSLLLSSWEVSDSAAPLLMKHFYTNLKSGLSKSKALQLAKLTYLNEASTNRLDMFYWGGFYIVGDDGPIFQQSNNGLLYSLIAAGVVLLIFLWMYRKRKSLKE